MTVGIHSVAAFKEKRTGVEEYAYRLIKNLTELQEAGGRNAASFVLYTNRVSGDLADFLSGRENFRVKILKFPFLWTQMRLSLEMLFNPPDVLFAPAHVLPLIRPKKSVVTVHGLEYERLPECYPFFFRKYLRWATKFSCRAAAMIIVPSESTRKDLIDFYGIPPEKISVVYHGFEVSAVSPKQTAAFLLKEPFFLYIGRIESKKNVGGIIRAFEICKKKRSLFLSPPGAWLCGISGLPHKLVLAGGDGFGAEKLKKQIEKSRFSTDIISRGYVLEEEKAALLRNASAFLFPSFYEGFGLPILEAQAAGVPVLTSNLSSMPEVAGEGGALFAAPENVEEIAEKMYKLVSDENLRKKLVAEGLKNAGRFSWKKCAEETLAILTTDNS